ncbi:hypothetical protein Taro_009931 [Colocasia esculenta]|uniref:Patatin n=1 Tax=Colocasia esculenta TaxID=4460 RepID=A0A843U5G3_COLES|nr:hypothetical protein [Colocasia esculenta]
MAEKMELTKLTLQIFSMLERQWLVDDARHASDEARQPQQHRGKTRVLCIDGGCGPSALAASLASLVRLEELLQSVTGDPAARVPDFFDLVAGTGTGGVLAVLLTAAEPADAGDGAKRRPIFSARDAAELLRVKIAEMYRRSWSRLGGVFRRRPKWRFSGKSLEGALRTALGDRTLRNAAKPLLVPCYDLLSAAPFVFSRAGAAESPALDFELWKVCRATLATPGLFTPFPLQSLDGATACLAVDGGLVMSNPASAAVTHVLHNKAGFPFVGGVEDLLVLSLGSGGGGGNVVGGRRRRWFDSRPRRGVTEVEIAMGGIADAVDQILSNAFCCNPEGYLRIQGNGSLRTPPEEEGEVEAHLTAECLRRIGEKVMGEKAVETLPLGPGGKRLSAQTNGERMEEFVRRRLLFPGTAPVVVAGGQPGRGIRTPALHPQSCAAATMHDLSSKQNVTARRKRSDEGKNRADRHVLTLS